MSLTAYAPVFVRADIRLPALVHDEGSEAAEGARTGGFAPVTDQEFGFCGMTRRVVEYSGYT